MTPDMYSLCRQFGMNPWAAINPSAGLVDAPDLLQQFAVALRSRALGTLSPGIIATWRNAQQAAHQTNWIVIAATVNAGVSHFDCLAKYAAASFKKSRSFFTCANSRFKTVSS